MSALDPLYTAVSWVLLQWHHALTIAGLAATGGLGWALSICLLVVTIRLLLLRPHLRQARNQRRLAGLQPELAALRRKHRDDPARLQREVTELQRAAGVNVLGGCLPLLAQIPVFVALVHVLRHLANSVTRSPADARNALYGFSPHQTLSAAHAKLFGAPLAATLRDGATQLHALAGTVTATHVVIVAVVLISAAAAFATQRLIRATSAPPPDGPTATVGRLMRYGAPLSVLGSAWFFPLGLILYWATSNVWTLGQQLYLARWGAG